MKNKFSLRSLNQEKIASELNATKKEIKEDIERNIEDFKNHYFIIVMDLCSSSVILEKLQMNGKIKIWRKMWKRIFNQLTRNIFFSMRCKPYKFVGDGFIILYRHQFADSLVEFMQRLNKMACDYMYEVLEEYSIVTKRRGFCYGIDRGILIYMNLLGRHEYMGEAINAATRLQANLKANEDANSVMVSAKVYDMIHIPEGMRQAERNCVLRNLYDDKEILCHQLWLD